MIPYQTHMFLLYYIKLYTYINVVCHISFLYLHYAIYTSRPIPHRKLPSSGQDFQGGFQIAAKRIGMLESFRAGAEGVQGWGWETFDQHVEKIV